MNEKEKEAIEEFKKQLRLAMNIDDIATTIRNGYAQIILDMIEKLQKDNEELKNAVNIVNKEKSDWIRAYQEEKDKQFELLRSSIPVKEVKDKIEEYKNMLKTCNKVKDIDRIKAINERILELEELLEGRK